jgi:NAD(P)-dependent dehydrogenase (short-subunit alcohol dehydrogenase family)
MASGIIDTRVEPSFSLRERVMHEFPDDFRALVFGASGGIGAALIKALSARSGSQQIIALSRASQPAFDLLDEASLADAAQVLKDTGPFDLIFDATGALEINGAGPEKSIKAIAPDVMARQFAINAIGPALIIKHFVPLLRKDRPAVLASLSAKVGSIGDNRLGGWISYRAAKAALNQIIHTAAIEVARTHPQACLVALHPGTVRTRLSEKWNGNHPTVSAEEAAENLVSVIASLTAADSGQFIAYDGSRLHW